MISVLPFQHGASSAYWVFHQEKIIPWLVGIAMILFLIALMFN